MFLLAIGLAAQPGPVGAIEFPGPAPGPAAMLRDGGQITLSNALLRATWDVASRPFRLPQVSFESPGTPIEPCSGDAFRIVLADGRVLKASDFHAGGTAEVKQIAGKAEAVQRAQRFAGWRVALPLVSNDGQIRLRWELTLRDAANYVQQALTLSSNAPLRVSEVTFCGPCWPKATVLGIVDGSPVVAGNVFFACEHPMARHRVKDGAIEVSLRRYRPIVPGEPWTVTLATGAAPEGQLRRAFVYYVERERARPYRPLCYYISWFDIAASNMKMTGQQCLDVIEAFGREMVTRRGVKLDAFVFDDGWDDTATLWQFHSGFPEGFAPMTKAAAKYKAFVGTWISPFGGYANPRAERLKYGTQQGYETNRSGFSLAGPKYYKVFAKVCADMMRNYGINYLKFDGIGTGAFPHGPGKDYGADMEALVRLLDDLRRIRADVFFNTTTGTWPSPYWLWHSDSVFRGGEDIGHYGVGSKRQQWITYRDMIGYKIRTETGPLYPFNSLKFQSVMCAPLSIAGPLGNEPKDLIDDIRMAAGSGTQVQEFFIRSSMMSPPTWDALAEGVGWVQRNADVLVDSHGIGGDPARGQPYGFASWAPRMGILVLRNPADRPAEIAVDLRTAFEIPKGGPGRYVLESPWKGAKGKPKLTLDAGQPHAFKLAPFEVLVFEALPVTK